MPQNEREAGLTEGAPRDDAASPAALPAGMKGCGPFPDAPPAAVHARGAPFGEPPLHICAIRRDPAGARLPLAAGAEADAPGELDGAPVQAAAAQGHAEVMRPLPAHGADPEAPSARGESAAELTGDPAIGEMIVRGAAR